jgi:hypothetical protein
MGVAQGTIVETQQHLDAVNRYPELGNADVSRAEAIRCWKTWETMSPPNRSGARRAWYAQRQAKYDRVGSMDQGFEDSDHMPKLIGGDIRKQTGQLLAQLIRAALRFKRQQFIELHP